MKQKYHIFYFIGGLLIALVIVFLFGKQTGEKNSEASIEFLNEKLRFYNSI